MWEIILMVLGGLGLFLFAINNLSDTLKGLLGDKAQKWLGYFTKNIFTAILTGVVVTTILDSSSAVIIMTIVLVNAGGLTFRPAVEPLKSHPEFLDWMSKLDNPLRGTAVGAIVTLVIQSSSATVGMVITLAKKGLINLGGGIAVMLGSELGTCSDTLLATIRSDRQAVKTGMFHLLFNIVSICIGLALFPLFVKLIEKISGNAAIEQQIANAHMIFNTVGVLVFIPLVPALEKMLNRLLPTREKTGGLSLNNS